MSWPQVTTLSSVMVGNYCHKLFILYWCSLSQSGLFPGSFALWGSLLAGGEVIAAKGTSNLMLSEEDRVYLRSGMPGWLYLDTRDKNNVVVLQVNTTTQTFIPAV